MKALILTTLIGDGKTPETAFRPAVSPRRWSTVASVLKADAEVVIETTDDAAEIAKLPAASVLWKEGDAPAKRTAALAKIAALKATEALEAKPI